ncbi:uncharacterized protein RSE6_10241 [Rhynchosporium secalis]|uniref:Isopenicillin N synthase-like Fe(2+) 2OG dioxygenase domain-containing protein n=1 Tax=Rhynchosporium secalis TaxID=38038 RepID=A0A1E1MK01_RHYSE|nr:uncharacterized protein RSE6_10241 [Rhynchosporium secalis]
MCFARGLGVEDDYFVRAHDVLRKESQTVLRLLHYFEVDKDPVSGEIISNIGDLWMSWSDDRFKSTFHRVKTPVHVEKDYFGPRYSMAFFNQPCTDAVIQGPGMNYSAVTGKEFTQAAMAWNYMALNERKAKLAEVKSAAEAGSP